MSDMTLEELNQFQALEKLIEREQAELDAMRESLGLHSPNLSPLPKAKGARDKIGETMPGIVDRERELFYRLETMYSLRNKILNWIHSLPTARLQLIANLRFVDGKTWEEVADFLEDGKTGDACKKSLYRYMEAERGEEKKGVELW